MQHVIRLSLAFLSGTHPYRTFNVHIAAELLDIGAGELRCCKTTLHTQASSATIALMIGLPPPDTFGQSLALVHATRQLRRQAQWSRADRRRPIYGASEAQPLTGIRILLTEDHDDTRDALEQILQHLGATVMVAATAREALAFVAAADIVVTDLAMPGGDGVWLLEQVNRSPRPIPVISVSGYSEELVPRLAQAPFARKLLKPVAVWELGGMIRDVLDGAGHGDGSASA